MRPKTLAGLLACTLVFTAGCATAPDQARPWDVRPVMDVRHGMQQARAYYQLGRYLQGQGRLEEAERAFGQALVAEPEYADALNAVGALRAARGDLDGAREMFARVEALAPRAAYLHNNMGYLLYLQGRHAEAVDALRTAVSLDPNFDRAWINLEQAARAAGMTEVAALAGRRILASAPAPAAAPSAGAAPRLTLAANLQPSGEAANSGLASAATAGEPPAPNPEASEAGARIELTEVTARRVAADRLSSAGTPVEPSGGTPAGMLVAVAPVDAEASLLKVGLRPLPQTVDGRVEVSNGNGIERFATRVAAGLRGTGVEVSRITNYDAFDLERSVIEYQPGFADAARALRERLRIDADLAEAGGGRWRSDLRLILGRDAVNLGLLKA